MYKKIKKCRLCGNNSLKSVINLGNQYLSGVFPRIGQKEPPRVPLELLQCRDCGLVQLACSVPINTLYGDSYGYLSSINKSMKQHLEDIAHEAEKIVKPTITDIVLDIGCNDGTLLKAYKNKAMKLGMDASHYNKYYKDTDIVFIPDFFDSKYFDNKPRIITSIAMFYDLEDPYKFVHDIKHILHRDGIWILEQSYLPAMLVRNAFDTICHEHLEYYTIKQIKYLLDKVGLKIFSLEFNDTNGGSIRLYVSHKESFFKEIIIDEPDVTDVDFIRLKSNIDSFKERLMSFLKNEKSRGKTIFVYGASTKGNVLLQYFGIDHNLIGLAVDKNKDKTGCWTPGTHIPIAHEDQIMDWQPDYYLVLPWHFRDGFIKQLFYYLDDGGKLIFPLPEPEIVCMEDNKIVIRQI